MGTSLIPLCAPTTNTMIQEKISTITVRIAVATFESVFRIPHFASIDVSPANMAEPNAYKIHIPCSFFLCCELLFDYSYCTIFVQKRKSHMHIACDPSHSFYFSVDFSIVCVAQSYTNSVDLPSSVVSTK